MFSRLENNAAASALLLGTLVVSGCSRGPQSTYVSPVLEAYDFVAAQPLADVLQDYTTKVTAAQGLSYPYVDILLRISQEVVAGTTTPLTVDQATKIRQELLDAAARVMTEVNDAERRSGHLLAPAEFLAVITKVIYDQSELGFVPVEGPQSTASSAVYAAHGVVQNASPSFAECWRLRQGVCQDLADVYLSIVDILNRGGVRLPIEILSQPGHVLVGISGYPGPGPVFETLEKGACYSRDYYEQSTGAPVTPVPLSRAFEFELANGMSWLVSKGKLEECAALIRTAEQVLPGNWNLPQALLLCSEAENSDISNEKRVQLRRRAFDVLSTPSGGTFARDFRLAVLDSLGDDTFELVVQENAGREALSGLKKIVREYVLPSETKPPFLLVLESRIELLEYSLLPVAERAAALSDLADRVHIRFNSIPNVAVSGAADAAVDQLHSGAEINLIWSRVLRWQGQYDKSLAVLERSQWRGTWGSRFEEALVLWQSGKVELLSTLLKKMASESSAEKALIQSHVVEAQLLYRAARDQTPGIEPPLFPSGLRSRIDEVVRSRELSEPIKTALAR